MESSEDADNITKNIVQEIIRECKMSNVEVDDKFCVFYVKLLTLDPSWKISPEKKLNRDYIQNIVNFIINKLQMVNCYGLVTMKIQYLFLQNIFERDAIIALQDRAVRMILKPLVDDVLTTTIEGQNKVMENKFYRKVAVLITLQAGLGNPKHAPVLREVTYALKSVLDEIDLYRFLSLENIEKIANITTYKNLVAGIRIFSKDSGRSVAEVDDLPIILPQILNYFMAEMTNDLKAIMEEVNLATSAIDNVHKLVTYTNAKVIQHDDEKHEILYELIPNYQDNVTEEDVAYAEDILVLARQREVYVRKFISFVDESEKNVKSLKSNLDEVLTRIHNVVKFKVALSTNVIYPLFLELAGIWNNLQQEAIVIGTYFKIYKKIVDLNKTVTHDSAKLMKMIGKGPLLTDLVRLERTKTQRIKQINNHCEVIFPQDMPDMLESYHYEFLGFCVWTLVQTLGGLMPGNPHMGICVWKHKNYVFCHPSAAAAFGMNPDWILHQAYALIRKKPELIYLVDTQEEIYKLRNTIIGFDKPTQISTQSNETQTEIHPIATNIDPNYVWNIWDYYRQAIKLANISNCRTRGQNESTHFRYPVFVQTTEPRDKICQTKIDNYMNVATPSNFIFGLRGRKDDVQHIIDLTRPYDEELFYKCATANKDSIIYKPKTQPCKSYVAEKKKKSPTVSETTIKSFPVISDDHSLDECICITSLTDLLNVSKD